MDFLHKRLRHRIPDIRLKTVEALAEMPPDPAIREALEHLLTWEPQYRVRQAAEEVLAQ